MIITTIAIMPYIVNVITTHAISIEMLSFDTKHHTVPDS